MTRENIYFLRCCIGGGLCGLGLAGLSLSLFLNYSWLTNAPSSPDFGRGLVHLVKTNFGCGDNVQIREAYLSDFQETAMRLLTYLTPLSVVGLFIVPMKLVRDWAGFQDFQMEAEAWFVTIIAGLISGLFLIGFGPYGVKMLNFWGIILTFSE